MARTNTPLRFALAALAALTLSACGAARPVSDTPPVTRAIDASAPVTTPELAPAVEPLYVTDINVVVPRELRVSERNSYYPGGDIVWREDPLGDRHQQVANIVLAGLQKGAAELQGTRAVKLDVVVTRFHALSEKARYTVGGVHAIQFDLTVLDAETGLPLGETHRVKADFDALGGMAAIRSEQRGITQKVRIINQLANVIKIELTSTEGYHGENLGLIGALNQI